MANCADNGRSDCLVWHGPLRHGAANPANMAVPASPHRGICKSGLSAIINSQQACRGSPNPEFQSHLMPGPADPVRAGRTMIRGGAARLQELFPQSRHSDRATPRHAANHTTANSDPPASAPPFIKFLLPSVAPELHFLLELGKRFSDPVFHCQPNSPQRSPKMYVDSLAYLLWFNGLLTCPRLQEFYARLVHGAD